MTAKRSHPRVTLIVLSIGGLAYAVLSSAVVPALPTIQHDLHASETGVTWLLTGYLLSASVGTAILGRLGDMFGKERVLLWTLVLLGAGTLLAAVSHSLVLLVAARIIQGVGGGIFPLSFGIIRDEFPRDRVAGSIGLVSAILGIGAGVGVVVGGLVVEHLGWHWLFWLPLTVVALAAFCTWRFIPESPVRSPGRVNWQAAALMSAGISTVLIAVSQTTAWGGGSLEDARAARGGTRSLRHLGGSRNAQRPAADRHVDDADPRRLDGQPDRVPARCRDVLVLLHLPAVRAAAEEHGLRFRSSVVVSGLYLLPATLGMVVVGPAAGVISARFGSKSAAIVGSAFTAVSFGFIAVAHQHPYEMLISAALLGIGIGLAFAALGNLVVQAVDPHQTGAAGA